MVKISYNIISNIIKLISLYNGAYESLLILYVHYANNYFHINAISLKKIKSGKESPVCSQVNFSKINIHDTLCAIHKYNVHVQCAMYMHTFV